MVIFAASFIVYHEMNVIKTDIEGLIVLEPKIFGDNRGYFYESYSKRFFDESVGHEVNFVQDNQSKSCYGVVRGLHFQKGEHAQAKLVRAVEGRGLDVAVDLRPGSATYGRWYAVELSADNHRQFFIPRGFAHGFAVLSKEAVFQYKTDNYYCPESEGAIAWDDPDLAIDWRLPSEDVILSEKDRHHPRLRDYRE